MGYRSASLHPESNPTHLTDICLSTTVNSPRFLGKTYSELNLVIYHLLPLSTHKSSLHPLLAQSPTPWTNLQRAIEDTEGGRQRDGNIGLKDKGDNL